MHSVETVYQSSEPDVQMWLLEIKPLKTSPAAGGRKPPGCSPAVCRQPRTETRPWVPVGPKGTGPLLSLGLSPWAQGSSWDCSSLLRDCTGAAAAAGALQGLHNSSKWPPPALRRQAVLAGRGPLQLLKLHLQVLLDGQAEYLRVHCSSVHLPCHALSIPSHVPHRGWHLLQAGPQSCLRECVQGHRGLQRRAGGHSFADCLGGRLHTSILG